MGRKTNTWSDPGTANNEVICRPLRRSMQSQCFGVEMMSSVPDDVAIAGFDIPGAASAVMRVEVAKKSAAKPIIVIYY